MTEQTYNVLFLCTGNSARSIMGEMLLNRLGKGRCRAYSAGSHPKGEVHPLALQLFERTNLSTDGLRSKSWDEFAAQYAPALDFVFTVCDRAAQEVCPVWPGQPMSAHWGWRIRPLSRAMSRKDSAASAPRITSWSAASGSSRICPSRRWIA